MITLKNIEIKGNFIEADFYSDGKEFKGHIRINTETKETESYNLPSEYSETDLFFAKQGLKKLIGETEVPKEKTIMWY